MSGQLRSLVCGVPAWRAVAALAAATLAGCSALQIDVDVYQGPLASHREVQLRQFAALAVAAKPLLAELRNIAEQGHPQKGARENFDNRVQGRDKDRYFDYPFEDKLAQFANGALSLYEDLADPETSIEVEQAAAHYWAFKRSLAVFNVTRTDCDLAKLIDPLSPGKDPEAKFRQTLASFLRAGIQQTPDALTHGHHCDGKTVETDSALSVAQGSRRAEILMPAWAAAVTPKSQPVNPSASEVYKNLATGQLAQAMAAKALPSANPDQVLALTQRLTAIGASFVAARQSMEHLWEDARLLVQLTAASGTAEQKALTADFLANTTQPRELACFLSAFPEKARGSEDLRDALLDPQFGLPEHWDRAGQHPRDNYGTANHAVKRLAMQFPLQTADWFKRIDDAMRRLSPEDLMKLQTCPQYQSPETKDEGKGSSNSNAELAFAVKTYGLARGTAVDSEFELLLESIMTKVALLSLGNARGFDTARNRDGIETLTNRYLQAVDQAGVRAETDSGAGAARHRLEEGLIFYAERLLFASNNMMLLDPQNRRTEDADFARRAALLQAVGNTIIVLVDDLRRQGEHEGRLVGRRDAEARAINRAFAGTASQTFDNLVQDISATLARQQREASPATAEKKKLDASTQKLQTQVEALRKDETTQKLAAEQASASAEQAANDARPFALARLSLAVPDKESLNGLFIAEDPAAAGDRAAVKAAVASLGKKGVDGAAVVGALKTWVNTAMATAEMGGASPRLARLEATRAMLDANAAGFASIAAQDAGKAYAEFNKRLADAWAQRLATFLGLARRALDAKREFEATTTLLKSRGDALSALGERATALTESNQLLGNDITTRTQVLQSLREVRAAVLAKADQGDTANAEYVRQVLLQELRDKAIAAPADALRFNLAVKAAERTRPMAPLTVTAQSATSSGQPKRSQRDVLDDLIAQLRQQRLQALASGQADRAANLDTALAAAFEQRAGMAYLRPASAYLRNIYSARSVQATPEVGWTNLLQRNIARLSEQPSADAKARADIEKQYWQNINSVELSGGGAANYVIAKDDVGNWYVKAYADDTSSIIRSVQGLALFNLGQRVDMNLLQRADLQRQMNQAAPGDKAAIQTQINGLPTSGSSGSAAGTGALAGIQRRYMADYGKQTAADLSLLLSALGALNDDLLAGWTRDLKGESKDGMLAKLKLLVSDDADEVKAALRRIEATADVPKEELASNSADAIIESARGLRRMRTRLATTIDRSADLVKAQDDALKNTIASRDAQIAAAKPLRAKLDQALADERDAQLVSSALKAQASPAATEAAANLAKATELRKKAEADLAPEDKKATTEVEKAKKAADDLDAAVANRHSAALAVVSVLGQVIDQVTARRLDTVKKLETALGFVGEAATEKPQ